MADYKYYQQLSERDLGILEDLYHYRALTTKQIKRRYFADSKYYVNKVLHNLRKDKFITTKTLKGSRKSKRGIAYHFLTETGLEYLVLNGKQVKGPIQNLYVKPAQLNYILSANDLMIDLTSSGWEVWDSRRLKNEYNLDSRMNILGLLKSPDKREYGYYILEEGALPTTIGKIQAEIRDFYMKIKDFIILVKGPNPYEEFVDKALHPSPKRVDGKMIRQYPLYTANELKIVPAGMAPKFYKVFPTRERWLNALSHYLQFEIISDRKGRFEPNKTNGEPSSSGLRQSFNTIIRYNGEEMYLVDLIESDLTLIQDINIYNEDSYRIENNRKLLVVAFEAFQEKWITNSAPYIQYKRLNFAELKNIMGID